MSVIGFLGAGNIAQAIIGGLLENGTSPDEIVIYDPYAATRDKAAEAGVRVASSNDEVVRDSDIIMICVKPDIVLDLLLALKVATIDKLFVSVAAGITTRTMQQLLTEGTALVRAMPNTPALVQTGMTGLFATPAVTASQRTSAEAVLKAVGEVAWVEEESALDAVTAVSGSGPAYYFLLMEAMIDAAVSEGLSKDVAEKLVLQTALGAARMANLSEDSPAELRQKVTSKGGTTQAALTHFTDNGFENLVSGAVSAARNRSIQMSKE